ncbi:hypothetical protein BDF20DRAFT_896142 [Mycotypha africana]|uniref:uncharacterized protein n=1 Tax=Mycotypha africana TaxID=64632 RepID=UPI0023007C5E|nr:uncharacterized protein BDF20DRAFT_896142 [Mycotypha africana]KAI8968402.1 hypothetical protein BDF20DRAFT_896142 [Mycotypha africana]
MKQISIFSSSPSIGTCAFLFGHRLLVGHACVACFQDGYVIIFVVFIISFEFLESFFFYTFFDNLA